MKIRQRTQACNRASVWRLAVLVSTLTVAGHARAFDLCAEKDQPPFKEALAASGDFGKDVATVIIEKYLAGIVKESTNQAQNIQSAKTLLAQWQLNTDSLLKLGVPASPTATAQMANISKRIAEMEISQARYDQLINGPVKNLKIVGNAVASLGVLTDSISATCNFMKLYGSEQMDWAKQLETAGDAIASSMGVVTAIGGAAQAIPGPWSTVILGIVADTKIIKADLAVADKINASLTARVADINDRYNALFWKVRRESVKSDSSTESVNGAMVLRHQIVADAQALKVEIASPVNLLMPGVLRAALNDSLDLVIAYADDGNTLRRRLENNYTAARSKIVARTSQPLPKAINVSSTTYPPAQPALSGAVLSADPVLNKLGEPAILSGTAKGGSKLSVTVIIPKLGVSEIVLPDEKGNWTFKKTFATADSLPYRVEVSDATSAKPVVVGQGRIEVQPATPGTPPAMPSITNFSLDKTDIQVGEAVTFTVRTSAPVAAVRAVVDQLAGGASLSLGNPSGNKMDWSLPGQVVQSAGNAANQYVRPVWAIATLNDAKRTELPASGPVKLTVRPAPADGLDVIGETIPDNTVIAAGASFVKSWTLKNTGTTSWNGSFCLQPVGNETALGSGKSCVTNTVAPNGQQILSVNMRAPSAVNADKSYIQHWRLVNAAGAQVGTLNPYARITVKGTAAHVVQNTMPEMVMQGSPLSFGVQTDKAAQSVSLELANPSMTYELQGSGLSWTLPPTVMKDSGNRPYTIKVVTAGEQTDTKSGSLFVRGSGAPLPTGQVIGASANPADLTEGQEVQFTAQTDAKVKAVTIRFDSASATPVGMRNPSGNGTDWVLTNAVVTPGPSASGYARSYWVGATRQDDTTVAPKGPYQLIVRPAMAGPSVSDVSPMAGTVGQKIHVIVTGRGLPAGAALKIADAQCSAPVGGLGSAQREYDCTLGGTAGNKALTVTGLQGVLIASRSFEVKAASNGNPSPIPIPVVPLNPQLNRSNTVQAFSPWSAQLKTNVPVYSADLVFSTGRRIPFEGGPADWNTRDENSRFSDPGNYSYELQIRRQASDPQVEKFAGGTLSVTPQPVQAVTPAITSALTTEQGKGYNLTISTDRAADRVAIKWADAANEVNVIALDAARTKWETGSRLFMQPGAVPFTVTVYKDGMAQPAGQVSGSVNVTVPASTMRLLSVSSKIYQGESPQFRVETSLSIARVTVQVASNAPVALGGPSGSGAAQSFAGNVLANLPGPSVPYTLVGYGAQGAEVARLTGTIAVEAAGDSLNGASPVPSSGIVQGDAVEWRFMTVRTTSDPMWLEFAAPIGTVPLDGTYFRRVFNEAPGSYAYRLMRKDHLGNVYAIQGASGNLTIKPKSTAAPAISQVAVNGRGLLGGKVTVSLKENLAAVAQASGAKGLVLKVTFPQPVGDAYFRMVSGNGTQWQTTALPSNLGDYLRGLVKPGVFPAQMYYGTGGVDTQVNLGGTVNFNLELAP